MSKKWYAKIKGAKIGLEKRFKDGEEYYFIIDSKSRETHGKNRTIEGACDGIYNMWGSWDSFEWIE